MLNRIPDDKASLKFVQNGLTDLKTSSKYNIVTKDKLTEETVEGGLKLKIKEYLKKEHQKLEARHTKVEMTQLRHWGSISIN